MTEATDEGGRSEETPFGPADQMFCQVCGKDLINYNVVGYEIGCHINYYNSRLLLCWECFMGGIRYAAEQAHIKKLREDK